MMPILRPSIWANSQRMGLQLLLFVVLAAGLGLRLRPLTENCPKPLIALAGRTLLDRALDHLVAAGVARVVINLHYLGHMIEAHLSDRSAPAIDFSHESEVLLETGGGAGSRPGTRGTVRIAALQDS